MGEWGGTPIFSGFNGMVVKGEDPPRLQANLHSTPSKSTHPSLFTSQGTCILFSGSNEGVHVVN